MNNIEKEIIATILQSSNQQNIDFYLFVINETERLLNKGEYRGKCFELCGQGHLSTAIVGYCKKS